MEDRLPFNVCSALPACGCQRVVCSPVEFFGREVVFVMLVETWVQAAPAGGLVALAELSQMVTED